MSQTELHAEQDTNAVQVVAFARPTVRGRSAAMTAAGEAAAVVRPMPNVSVARAWPRPATAGPVPLPTTTPTTAATAIADAGTLTATTRLRRYKDAPPKQVASGPVPAELPARRCCVSPVTTTVIVTEAVAFITRPHLKSSSAARIALSAPVPLTIFATIRVPAVTRCFSAHPCLPIATICRLGLLFHCLKR